MSIFDYLFRKNLIEEMAETSFEQEDEAIVYARDEIDIDNEQQRSSYVTNCLEQIADASLEVELLKDEYGLITSYLTDIEEIEALPEDMRQEINDTAMHLASLESEALRFSQRQSRMSDMEYYTLKKQEAEVEEAIGKLKEAEDYAKLIKKDLRRLHGERHAHEFRALEMDKSMENAKGMAIIFGIAFVVCILLLCFLQFGLEMNAFVGFFVAIVFFAIAETILSVRFMDANKERVITRKELNKIIQLQNTVKIRYVNNRKLLDYLYMKYHVQNGARLEKLWADYRQEKEERRQYTESTAQAEFYQKQLISQLSAIRVKTPERFLTRPEALLDKREMVELRHELILQRQAIREKIDYNSNLAQSAKQEISQIAHKYPQYASELLEMTEQYEKTMTTELSTEP